MNQFKFGDMVQSKIINSMKGKIIKIIDINNVLVLINNKEILFNSNYLSKI